jgi:sugar-specific transcriptional regulator TrmB
VSVYDWIDPQAETVRANRAERQAVFAKDDARRELVGSLGGIQKFAEALERAVAEMAHRLAQEHVRPELLRTFDDYERAKAKAEQIEKQEYRRGMVIASAVVESASVHAVTMVDRPVVTFQVGTIGPVRYNVAVERRRNI